MKLVEWIATPKFLSILPWLMLACVTTGAAGGAWGAWAIQGGRLATEQAAHAKLKDRVLLIEILNKAVREQAQADISALSTDLAHSRKQREIQTVEIVREIPSVASPTRQCASAAAISVLRRPDDRPAAQDQGAARIPRNPVSGPAAAAPAGFVSELAVIQHLDTIRDNFLANREAHRGAIGSLRAAERAGCVEFVE